MQKRLFKHIVIIVLLSVFIIPSTYALLRKTGIDAVSIKAASWDVSLNQTGINNSLTVVADSTSTASYTVKVRSNSEVDVDYSIVISNVPQGVSVQLDNTGQFEQGVNGTITFSNVGTILYSDSNKEKTHTLTFKVATGTTAVLNQEVDIDVLIKQVL